MLKPLALGYTALVPEPVRVGVKNFFYNLGAPVRIINNILQGKERAAEAEVARFLLNTSAGVLGLGNPAKKYPELNLEAEDLGLTLGRYGPVTVSICFFPCSGQRRCVMQRVWWATIFSARQLTIWKPLKPPWP